MLPAYWPCERLRILICLSTAVSEPWGYKHGLHTASACSFWGDGNTSEVAQYHHLLPLTRSSVYSLSLLKLLLADFTISCWWCIDTTTTGLFCLVPYRVICDRTSAALLCLLLSTFLSKCSVSQLNCFSQGQFPLPRTLLSASLRLKFCTFESTIELPLSADLSTSYEHWPLNVV